MGRKQSLAHWAALPVAVLTLASGCSLSYLARGAERYRKDTRALLESNESSFRDCYESLLADQPDSAGTVAVQFEVAAETGRIGSAKSLPSSTAPEGLQSCVVEGLDGLQLDPPDERTGLATMTFLFEQG